MGTIFTSDNTTRYRVGDRVTIIDAGKTYTGSYIWKRIPFPEGNFNSKNYPDYKELNGLKGKIVFITSDFQNKITFVVNLFGEIGNIFIQENGIKFLSNSLSNDIIWPQYKPGTLFKAKFPIHAAGDTPIETTHVLELINQEAEDYCGALPYYVKNRATGDKHWLGNNIELYHEDDSEHSLKNHLLGKMVISIDSNSDYNDLLGELIQVDSSQDHPHEIRVDYEDGSCDYHFVSDVKEWKYNKFKAYQWYRCDIIPRRSFYYVYCEKVVHNIKERKVALHISKNITPNGEHRVGSFVIHGEDLLVNLVPVTTEEADDFKGLNERKPVFKPEQIGDFKTHTWYKNKSAVLNNYQYIKFHKISRNGETYRFRFKEAITFDGNYGSFKELTYGNWHFEQGLKIADFIDMEDFCRDRGKALINCGQSNMHTKTIPTGVVSEYCINSDDIDKIVSFGKNMKNTVPLKDPEEIIEVEPVRKMRVPRSLRG